MTRRLTKEEAMDRCLTADKRKGRRFEYIDFTYSNAHKTRVKIRCLSCGGEAERWYIDHIRADSKVPGHCKFCGPSPKRKKTSEEFIALSKRKYPGELDYSLCKYIDYKETVALIHLSCGNQFSVEPDRHLNHDVLGCPFCSAHKLTRETLIHKAARTDTNYLLTEIPKEGAKKTKLTFTCKIHGLQYRQEADHHIRGVVACPQCRAATKNFHSLAKDTKEVVCWLYIALFSSEKEVFCKVGATRNPDKRSIRLKSQLNARLDRFLTVRKGSHSEIASLEAGLRDYLYSYHLKVPGCSIECFLPEAFNLAVTWVKSI